MSTIVPDRPMAYVYTVKNISPIDGRDFIVLAQVEGWNCIVKKDEFKIGDIGVYFTIDSVLDPAIPEFAFLEGKRIKTKKISKVISQGLFLPFSLLTSFPPIKDPKDKDDVTEHYNVKKYVRIEEESVYDQKINNSDTYDPFPSFMPKTDEDRIQNNLSLLEEIKGRKVIFTRKEDGTSCTFTLKDGKFSIQQRNYTCKVKVQATHQYYDIEEKYQIEKRMRENGLDNIAIRGELVGPKINGNKLQLTENEYHVFNIFDIAKQQYIKWDDVLELTKKMELDTAPEIRRYDSFDITDVKVLLEIADKLEYKKKIPAEGFVLSTNDDGIRRSAKVISNNYLLKHE